MNTRFPAAAAEAEAEAEAASGFGDGGDFGGGGDAGGRSCSLEDPLLRSLPAVYVHAAAAAGPGDAEGDEWLQLRMLSLCDVQLVVDGERGGGGQSGREGGRERERESGWKGEGGWVGGNRAPERLRGQT